MKITVEFLTYVSDLFSIPLKTPKRIDIILEHAVRALSADGSKGDQHKVDVPYFQDTNGEFLLSAETLTQFEHHAKKYSLNTGNFPSPTKILVPKENFCCGKLLRLQTRYASTRLYCESSVLQARSYHGVCKSCNKSYYHGFCLDDNSRDYSEYLEDDFLMISPNTGFSRGLLREMVSTIFIGAVPFEKMAEIYNEKPFSPQLNPERLEEAFFLFKILPFIAKFHPWPRDSNGRVRIEDIAESVYPQIRKEIDEKWMSHICDEEGCKNRYVT